LGQSDKFPLKPQPQSTHYAMQTLGVDKSESLFVGDGETDVQTAKNAGIDCLSVLWGYRDKTTLKNAGASNFASTYSELLKFILHAD
jgi:phosphoglycolate phosphatase